MSAARSLISPTSNPLLERALREKLQRRSETAGGLGELEPLAVRLGLMQNTLKPRFREPQVVVFAADHGLVVDGAAPPPRRQTHELAQHLLSGRMPHSCGRRLPLVRLQPVHAVTTLTQLVRPPRERGTR